MENTSYVIFFRMVFFYQQPRKKMKMSNLTSKTTFSFNFQYTFQRQEYDVKKLNISNVVSMIALRRRLVTDPQLRQEVATAVRRHLRANPPRDSSVDDVEAAFAIAIMRTAELVIPPQERRRPGRGWSGDVRTEAELQAATDGMHTA